MQAREFQKLDLFRFLDNHAYPPDVILQVLGHTECKGWVMTFAQTPGEIRKGGQHTFGDDYLSKYQIEMCGKGVAPFVETVRLPKKHTMAKPIHWTVDRKMPYSKIGWRNVFRGSEKVARESFSNLTRDLKEGSVRLVDNKGEVVKQQSAPTVRTR